MHAVSFVLMALKWRLTTRNAAVGDCLTKHNFADVRDLMVLISVDDL
jgi:hypothetical protein